MFEAMLKELSADAGSILSANVLSLDGEVIASHANQSEERLSDGFAGILIAAMPKFAHQLANEARKGEVDSILLISTDAQVLIGALGGDKLFCCLLPVGVEIETIMPWFHATKVKLLSLQG